MYGKSAMPILNFLKNLCTFRCSFKLTAMKKYLAASILLAITVSSCQLFDRHLIPDKDYREDVNKKFNHRREIARGRDSALFGVFNQELSVKEREGLEFLYGFMPLSDLAMHDGGYVLDQVRASIEARKYFSWGRKVPSDIFLHFVLPYRINNEYTDSARRVFYNELKERVKGMSMYDAALEVNHWCHEKVVYRSTDERTSGPLTTVRTAFGRCGEESTFAVAALRSVCIPARQVYTPRWAHTDDNHAWVEVWIKGKWYYLGACEPDPDLNMGWFTGPAKRAMLTRTFVFGQYKGAEETLEQNDFFTEINLLPNYAPTKTLPVRVVDANGVPQPEAKVEFSLYNYAEFYPLATKTTDSEGKCSLITGYGDLIVWASKGGQFGCAAAQGVESGEVEVVIRSMGYNLSDAEYELVPPREQEVPQADRAKVEANNLRLKQEDDIRNQYIATFIDSSMAILLATEKGVDESKTWDYLSRSRGNWREIFKFIQCLKPSEVTLGMALLANISDKDLHDITARVLADHLAVVDSFPALVDPRDYPVYDRYVLSPRIGREFITPWRSYLQRKFTFDQIGFFRNSPMNLVKWINDNIALDTISNYYRVPLSPEGVYELRLADRLSRDVFFVAACRSFGIPSRLEPATRRPQYYSQGSWVDVFFEKQSLAENPKGQVEVLFSPAGNNFTPQYYSHYTIARFARGRFVTLDYEYDEALKKFPFTLSVDTGYYRLMTGNRLSNGTVLCKVKYFRVSKGLKSSVTLEFMAEKKEVKAMGSIDPGLVFSSIDGQSTTSIASLVTDGGLVLAIIDPVREPTKHLMVDIAAVRDRFEKWGGRLVFLVARGKMPTGFDPATFKSMPANSIFGSDSSEEISGAISKALGRTNAPEYPQIVIINRAGEIYYSSEGYSIGLGDQILKNL